MGKTVASLTQTATPRHPAKPSAAKHPAACRRSAWAEPQDARWPEALCGWVKGSEGARTGKRRRPWLRWGRREAAGPSARPAPSPTPPRQRPARRLGHRAGFRREGAKSVTRNVTHGLRVSRVGAEIPARQGSRRAAPVVTGKEVHESRPLPNQRCHQGVPGCDRAVPRDRGARPPLC